MVGVHPAQQLGDLAICAAVVARIPLPPSEPYSWRGVPSSTKSTFG
jgi:hypothetical protein